VIDTRTMKLALFTLFLAHSAMAYEVRYSARFETDRFQYARETQALYPEMEFKRTFVICRDKARDLPEHRAEHAAIIDSCMDTLGYTALIRHPFQKRDARVTALIGSSLRK
jgi:hypothetical protein